MTELDLFAAAIATPDAAARAALLDRECGGNPALRARLDKLLAAHFTAHPLLGPTADGTVTHSPGNATGTPDAATVERPGKDEHVGAVLGGKYKLIEEIGEGGMGSVYMAQQTEPVKRAVAVKVIKAGMDSKAVLARFEAERQALAMMDHPNIARVLDAGTTESGRPYFVMELVKGVPITQYCDERKLTPRQRLELFVPVCNAIQHAHQKGVIHRDIKPNNVLVAMYDDRPVPKVIDFGVAKAAGQTLTDKTLMTGFGAVVGTPEYMSPEQANLNNLDIDTRSDVYSLGVLLYELLTGSTPVDRKSLGQAALLEVLRIVREVEAPRPSAKLSTIDTLPSVAANRGTEPAKLSKLMKGELDWVLLKALEKDRARRYETANGFAADVQRYLSGEQVQAVPPSLGYRLRKAYRRNKGPVLAVGVVSLAMLLGFAGTTSGMVWALDAEGKAKRDRDAAVKAQREADGERDRANVEAAKATAAKEQQATDQYISDMQLLPLAFDQGTAAEVNKLLERHLPKRGEPDRRGFDWHYWNRQQKPQALTEQLPDCVASRHTAWAVSDDGRRIGRIAGPATADDLPVLTVWDQATRRVVLKHRLPIRPPEGWTGGGFSPVAPLFSPDGDRVEVEWSFSTTNRVQPGGVVGPNGPQAIRIVAHLRQVIEVGTGKVLLEPPGTGQISGNGGRFSRDGRRFASVSGSGNFGDGEPAGAVRVWDLDTGKLVTPEKATTLYSQVQFHPDGETCVTTGPHTDPNPALAALAGGGTHLPATRLSLRDVRTGAEKWAKLVPCGYLDDLTVSPDGKWIAASLLDELRGSAASVTVWEAASGNEVSAWPVPSQASRPQVMSLAFSPGGTRLRVNWVNRSPMGGGGGGGGFVVGDLPKDGLILLNPRTGIPFPPLETHRPEDNYRAHLAFSPDENRVIGFDLTTLRTWDVRTGLPHRTVRGPVAPPQLVQFTPDGNRLWTVETSGAYKEWDLRPPRVATVEFEGGNALLSADFAVSADGGRFAHLVHNFDQKTGSDEFAVRTRGSEGKLGKLLPPSPRGIGPKDFSYTSRCGLSLSRDGGRVLLTRSEGRGSRVGDVVPADWRDGLPPPDLTVWDCVTGKRLLFKTLDASLMSAAVYGGHIAVLSPDGQSVAVGMEPAKDGDPVRVRVFDVDTGREQTARTLAGATSLFALTFSPDGKRLAAASATHDPVGNRVSAKVVVWDANGGEPAVSADLYRDVKAPAIMGYRLWFKAGVVWTPDGSRLVVSHGGPSDAGLAAHDAATGKQLVTLEHPPAVVGTWPVVTSAVCSPDGKRIAAFIETMRSGYPGVEVWDAESGKELLTLRKPGTLRGAGRITSRSDERQLAFTPDGYKLLAWEFEPIPKWTPESGDEMVNGYTRSVWDASPPQEAKK